MEFEIITRYIKQETARIRRPANAFMLYANHNRKKMAQKYPLDSNKEISKRLGNSWKELDSNEKLHYYDLAKQVDIEHKKKYPDYVYNPKEARIRKAMREASRERALSVTPMSPRAVRRPSSVAPTPSSHAPWNFGNEDQLMMAPAAHGMRGSLIGSPMCGSSGFPIQAAESGPFAMQSMHYGKHSMHPLAHSASGTYMQANSIPHLPQPPDLWQPYEDPMRNTPGPYILPQQMGYAQPPTVPSPAILPSTPHLEKPKLEPETFHHIEDSQSSHTNENVPPNGDGDKLPMVDPVFENKVDSIQPLMGNGNMHAPTSEPFMPSYGENIMSQGNVYEKNETVKSKKAPQLPAVDKRNLSSSPSSHKTSPKFHLHPKSECDYHREYIRNYLITNNCHGIEILMNDSGVSQAFNYVTYNSPRIQNYDFNGGIDAGDVLVLGNWRGEDRGFGVGDEVLNLSAKKF